MRRTNSSSRPHHRIWEFDSQLLLGRSRMNSAVEGYAPASHALCSALSRSISTRARSPHKKQSAPAHTCEARLSSLHTPSARILPTNRPLLASSHFLCALVHSLSWRGALRLSLRHGALRRWASRKIHRCLDPPRRAPARVGVRCPLVLPPCAPAGCVVVRSAVARALPGPPFGPPFEPEAPSRRIWRVAGEMCAAVWASRMGCASVERACGASASLMCIISAFCTRASSAQ